MSDTTNKLLIPVDLNEGQRTAFKNITHFLDAPGDSMFLLEGYAGSGKTYLVGKIIRQVFKKYPGWKIAVTAPTNKAVKVLRKSSSMKDKNLEFQTIHKLLGLKEQITPDGKQIFVKQREEDSTIEDFHLVIVDEVSMLSDDLFTELYRHSRHVKILYMGDPAQVPPVGKENSIPFIPEEREKYDIERNLLMETMRQKEGNPILTAAFAIRNDLKSEVHPDVPTVITLNDEGLGVVPVDMNKKENRDMLNRHISEKFDSPEFVANADYAKVIAWRNVTVNNLNRIIRQMIYKMIDLPKLMPGEKLIANKPIITNYETILFSTNDEFEVISYEVRTRTFATNEEAIKLKIYETKVRHMDINNREIVREIEILHEDSEAAFNKYALFLKNDAIRTRGANRSWVKYYNFLRQFADISYNYAITVHKAQGSTYTHTFVIEDDIDYNSNVYERNRIKYTAYTRPTNTLYIAKRY